MEDKSQAADIKFEDVFDSKAKIKILCYLTETYPSDWPMVEITQQTSLPKKTTRKSLDDLTEMGILKHRTLGKRLLYTLANDKIYEAITELEDNFKKYVPTSQPTPAAS